MKTYIDKQLIQQSSYTDCLNMLKLIKRELNCILQVQSKNIIPNWIQDFKIIKMNKDHTYMYTTYNAYESTYFSKIYEKSIYTHNNVIISCVYTMNNNIHINVSGIIQGSTDIFAMIPTNKLNYVKHFFKNKIEKMFKLMIQPNPVMHRNISFEYNYNVIKYITANGLNIEHIYDEFITTHRCTTEQLHIVLFEQLSLETLISNWITCNMFEDMDNVKTKRNTIVVPTVILMHLKENADIAFGITII